MEYIPKIHYVKLHALYLGLLKAALKYLHLDAAEAENNRLLFQNYGKIEVLNNQVINRLTGDVDHFARKAKPWDFYYGGGVGFSSRGWVVYVGIGYGRRL